MDEMIYEEHEIDSIQPFDENASAPLPPIAPEPVIIRGTGNLTMYGT